MTTDTAFIARAAALQLHALFGDGLVPHVEAVLAEPNPVRRDMGGQGQLINVASLLVAVASLGWSIFNDMSQPEAPAPSAVSLKLQITLQAPKPGQVSAVQREQVIDVVIEEILRRNADAEATIISPDDLPPL